MKSIDLSSLPNELFTDSALRPPQSLVAAYTSCLTKLGLMDVAKTPPPPHDSAIVGGSTLEETHNHFAWRFLNSASRVQRLLLDTDGSFAHVPDELIQVLSYGDVAVLDYPGGCGGSLLGLISLIADLRRHKLLPSLPLNLSVYCADISPHSHAIYNHMMTELMPFLKKEAISVKWTTSIHDILKVDSAVELCDIWLNREASTNEHLVLIGNVGGLAKEALKEIEPSFRHITERLLRRSASICWIESASKTNKKIIDMIKASLAHIPFLKRLTADAAKVVRKYLWHCPLNDNPVTSFIQLIDYVTVPKIK